MKDFKGCESGYSMFILKWVSFYFYRVTKPLKHLSTQYDVFVASLFHFKIFILYNVFLFSTVLK